MTSSIQSSVDSFVSERRLEYERLADSGPQAGPKRFYEKIVGFRALAISSIVSSVLSELANAMASAAPALSIVGRTFKVISGVSLIASGMVGLMALLWGVYCLIHINDISNEHRTPFGVLFADFQIFSQEYRRRYEPLRNQEREVGDVFIEREIIPEEFEDDEVLSQHICPIARNPIRYPVTDPTSGTMYERVAIEEWIDRHHTSPLSRTSLERDQLAPDREAEERINTRLRELQERQNRTTQRIQAYLAARQEEDRGSDPLPSIEQRQEDPTRPPRSVSPSTQQTQPPIY